MPSLWLALAHFFFVWFCFLSHRRKNVLSSNKNVNVHVVGFWGLRLSSWVLRKASCDPFFSKLLALTCQPVWTARYHHVISPTLYLMSFETRGPGQVAYSKLVASCSKTSGSSRGRSHSIALNHSFESVSLKVVFIKMKSWRKTPASLSHWDKRDSGRESCYSTWGFPKVLGAVSQK